MSALALTLARLGFLVGIWMVVIAVVQVLRRDLAAPKEARPQAKVPASKTVVPPQQAAPVAKSKPKRSAQGGGARKLVVLDGPLAGTSVPLTNAIITVGRASDSTIVLHDDFASSRHARFYPSEGQWIVEDLGSTNGTWIDRTRITGPTVLPVGASVRIGRVTFQLQK
jgi:hypothetical protein